MGVKVESRKTINAPADTVWAVLDDFAGIETWSRGIQKSHKLDNNGAATGVGAERRCELGPGKALHERITSYEHGKHMTIDVFSVEGLPMKSSNTTFTLTSVDANTTQVEIDADMTPKAPGFLVKLMGGIITKKAGQQLDGLLDDLAKAAESKATTV